METQTWESQGRIWDGQGFVTGACQNENTVEGRVATAFWDIYDPNVDGFDTYNDGFPQIWSAMISGGPSVRTFRAYWDVLRGEVSNRLSAGRALLQNTIVCPEARLPVADFDRDLMTDLSVYNPANGDWFIWQSSTGTSRIQNWGWSGASRVKGDFDGDGKTDLAVYNPATGDWFIWQSSTGTTRIQNWGWSSASPVPGDYDGEGKADLAVYDTNNYTWWILQSGNGQTRIQIWGFAGAIPVP